MNSNYLLTNCKSKDIITELTIFKHCIQTALALAWSDMILEIVLDLVCIPKESTFRFGLAWTDHCIDHCLCRLALCGAFDVILRLIPRRIYGAPMPFC